MEREIKGDYLIGEFRGRVVRPYLPPPLPPEPPLQINADTQELIDECNLALGKLNAISVLLPDESLFVYSYQRKEAILSSQIEGINSTLPDLFQHELRDSDHDDVSDTTEVSNYLKAASYGFELVDNGETISETMVTSMHTKLLASGRGSDMNPGRYRREQSAIQRIPSGDIVFVPPPPELVQTSMDDLFAFINDPVLIRSPLLRAALAHVQFETIHPFEDGNGRLGRLLINLILTKSGILSGPSLYPSLYLKQNRERYYELLTHVRRTGDWEAWVTFFLTGIKTSAEEAFETANRLSEMLRQDKRRVETSGRRANSTLRVLDALARHPILSMNQAARLTNLSYPTVSSAMERMESMGITREFTGMSRNRQYVYAQYIAILAEGTEPL